MEQLDGEPKALRKLARQNKYEIKAVLWNPHQAMHQLMVSAVKWTNFSLFAASHPFQYFKCSVSRNWRYGMLMQSAILCCNL
jgi:hypothetical protein